MSHKTFQITSKLSEKRTTSKKKQSLHEGVHPILNVLLEPHFLFPNKSFQFENQEKHIQSFNCCVCNPFGSSWVSRSGYPFYVTL